MKNLYHEFQLLQDLEVKITSNFGKFAISESIEPVRVLSLSGDTHHVNQELQELRFV